MRASRAAALLPALGTALAALVGAILILELWRADLAVPLDTGGDVPFIRMLVAAIDEQGGVLANDRLGAPLGQELRDYPEVDPLSFVLLRLLTAVSGDPDVALNLFFLLTFPLVALAAFVVLRRRVSAGAAAATALLFTFLPYHLERGESHLFLAAYWAVPFAAHLVLVLLAGEQPFARRPGVRGLRGWATPRTLGTLAACVVVGSAWFYYAAYSLLLLAAAALVGLVAHRSRRALAHAAAVLGAVALVTAVSLAPYALHRLTEGANSSYAVRAPGESEQYSLKLTQLLMPIEDHRVGRLARFSRYYGDTAPAQNDSNYTHLGAVASLGLAWLLVVVAAAAAAPRARSSLARYGPAAAGGLIALLFATNGAVGSLVGYLVTAQLRAWSRMSVFIAFFALLAVALALDSVRGRLAGGRRRAAFGVALAALAVLGVLDQTSPAQRPDYDAIAAAERRDAAYVARVERALPAGAAVFQLPYVSFPEGGLTPGWPPYDQLRGYLHSEKLRWSFGDVTGRPGEWRDDLRGKPPAELARAVAAAGFAAIEVSRQGYRDGGVALERRLRELLAVTPIVRADGQVALYDLRPHARQLRARLGPSRLAALRRATLQPRPPD